MASLAQDHREISERTAQPYMRVAKNRAEIESQIRNDDADLTLSQAAAEKQAFGWQTSPSGE